MRHALAGALCAAASLAALLVPQEAEAAWPKTIDIEICWNGVCDGTFAQWTLRRNGEFVDQYGAGGDFFWEGFYPSWPYGDDFLLFYDNGLTSYTGDVQGGKVFGSMVTYAFYPPYVIYGTFCQDGCP